MKRQSPGPQFLITRQASLSPDPSGAILILGAEKRRWGRPRHSASLYLRSCQPRNGQLHHIPSRRQISWQCASSVWASGPLCGRYLPPTTSSIGDGVAHGDLEPRLSTRGAKLPTTTPAPPPSQVRIASGTLRSAHGQGSWDCSKAVKVPEESLSGAHVVTQIEVA